MKRTLNEIDTLIQHIFFLKVCYGQSTIGFENVVRIRGNQLVSNTQEHAVLAILENKGQSDEVYRHINCMLVVKNSNVCENCQKKFL
ncbi:hypothetical protein RhiirC2_805098 [Rhizophagus irregularis]|nr:hypothetical protein RhiirC2_805098 [Rhizophagus irregularis]